VSEIRLEWELLPKQAQFLELLNEKRYVAYIGGMGSGKTTIGCIAGILETVRVGDNLGLVARRTYRELRDTTRETFLRLIPQGLIKRFSDTDNELELYTVDGRVSKVLFRSLDDLDKIKSLNLGWFYIDEASEVSEHFFNVLRTRLRRDVGARKGWITSNPPPTTHWIYRMFVERRDDDFGLVQASSYENKYLPSDFFRDLERMDDSWRKVYLEGQFGVAVQGRPVFPQFRREVHVRDGLTVNPFRPVYRGWDFGLHRPACVWCQIDDDGRLYVLGEFLGHYLPFHEFLQKVIAISNRDFRTQAGYEDFIDPSGFAKNDLSLKSRVEIMQEHGINPVGRMTEIRVGIDIMTRLLTTYVDDMPLLIVSSNCPILISGFEGGYHYPEDSYGELKPMPNKDGYYEHLFDALRYVVVNMFLSKPVAMTEEIRVDNAYWW